MPIYSSFTGYTEEGSMDVEANELSKTVELKTEATVVRSDGMLLYVSQSSYEPGTSPLSLWVPIRAYTQDTTTTDLQATSHVSSGEAEGPIDVFER
jgi:snurportin-1